MDSVRQGTLTDVVKDSCLLNLQTFLDVLSTSEVILPIETTIALHVLYVGMHEYIH